MGVRLPNANVINFTWNGTSYLPPAGYPDWSLQQITGVEWRAIHKNALGINDLIYHFPLTNPGGGVFNALLQKIEDANGNLLTMTRLADNRINRSLMHRGTRRRLSTMPVTSSLTLTRRMRAA